SSLTGIRPRPDRGHRPLFEVLTLCWRARRRLLAERRLQQQQIDRQLRQLDASMQRRAEELRGATSPWARHWVGGLSVAGGAAAIATTGCTAVLPVASAIWWRQDVPVASRQVSAPAARTAGKRLSSPICSERS